MFRSQALSGTAGRPRGGAWPGPSIRGRAARFHVGDHQAGDGRRSQLLDALMLAAPQLVADGLAFHMAVAERLGLSLTDLRYLQHITEAGLPPPAR
jgi:hypothetical protein